MQNHRFFVSKFFDDVKTFLKLKVTKTVTIFSFKKAPAHLIRDKFPVDQAHARR